MEELSQVSVIAIRSKLFGSMKSHRDTVLFLTDLGLIQQISILVLPLTTVSDSHFIEVTKLVLSV